MVKVGPRATAPSPGSDSAVKCRVGGWVTFDSQLRPFARSGIKCQRKTDNVTDAGKGGRAQLYCADRPAFPAVGERWWLRGSPAPRQVLAILGRNSPGRGPRRLIRRPYQAAPPFHANRMPLVSPAVTSRQECPATITRQAVLLWVDPSSSKRPQKPGGCLRTAAPPLWPARPPSGFEATPPSWCSGRSEASQAPLHVASSTQASAISSLKSAAKPTTGAHRRYRQLPFSFPKGQQGGRGGLRPVEHAAPLRLACSARTG